MEQPMIFPTEIDKMRSTPRSGSFLQTSRTEDAMLKQISLLEENFENAAGRRTSCRKKGARLLDNIYNFNKTYNSIQYISHVLIAHRGDIGFELYFRSIYINKQLIIGQGITLLCQGTFI